MMKTLLMVTLMAYIGSSPRWLSLNGILLNKRSTPDSLTAYIRSSSWPLRPIQSHSWMTKVLLMVALISYIRFSPW